MDNVIDAHHHLWRYAPEDYPWIQDDMAALRRDFVPEDLMREMHNVGIGGAVAVQARQSVRETEWLLQCADEYPEMLGVVGWAPLANEGIAAQLAAWEDRPKLRGLRHVVQDEPEDDFLLGEAFNRGIRAMRGTHLVYDLLVRASQLPASVRFVASHPEQDFVLDHLAKPSIRTGSTDLWQRDFEALAAFPNVTCKLSGLVTEADWSTWTEAQIEPYLEIALGAFGPQRLMAGSDWPVCLLASSYERWWSLLFDWVSPLRESERRSMLRETAKRVYGLDTA